MARPSQCPACGCFEACLYPTRTNCAERDDRDDRDVELDGGRVILTGQAAIDYRAALAARDQKE